ncbi:LemA family protein [Comamonas sp. GB3 AK4-5]|uniref:LemA family protein n=1 Tax=Comamonas sp. GB3 AK4-5 TaxID=3231487 RepID=UPI00351E977E
MGEWGVLGMVVLALLWAMVTLRRLRRLYRSVEAAYGQIDVQLQRRYALIAQWVDAARAYLAQETAVLECLLRACSEAQGAASTARLHPGQPGTMGALAMAEQGLNHELDRLRGLVSATPELRSDTHMQQLGDAIATAESHIGFTRQIYNDQVLGYNDHAARLPDLLVARLMGFAPLDMLVVAPGTRVRSVPQMPL